MAKEGAEGRQRILGGRAGEGQLEEGAEAVGTLLAEGEGQQVGEEGD